MADTEVREREGGRGWKERGRERGKGEGGGREGMDELFALSVDTGSKRPGKPASDVAETKRKKENAEMRQRGREGR